VHDIAVDNQWGGGISVGQIWVSPIFVCRYPLRNLRDTQTRRLCGAVKANQLDGSIKFVLMNTIRNRDLDEKVSFAKKTIFGLLSLLWPPQADKEDTAEFLRSEIGQNDALIEWVVILPDGLIDEDTVTEYELHPSPTRSAIFDAGKTSRINCAHFMADLITDDAVWQAWKGQMPVVYNKSSA
jgi:hypothetical protein